MNQRANDKWMGTQRQTLRFKKVCVCVCVGRGGGGKNRDHLEVENIRRGDCSETQRSMVE